MYAVCLFRMAVALDDSKRTLSRLTAARTSKAQRVSHKACLHVRRANLAPTRLREVVKAICHPLFIRVASLTLRESDRRCNPPTFLGDMAFRVKSRPDFSCYLFDES